jgi:hypothetical protein
MAKLAVTPPLAPAREEIRDLALLGVAIKLRQSAALESRPGDTAFSYLGQSDLWAAPLRSDAQYAFRTAVKEPVKESSPRSTRGFRERLGNGRVTAVVSAPNSGDVFVAFESGELVCFRPTDSETRIVTAGVHSNALFSLAVNDEGTFLVRLEAGESVYRLIGYSRLPNGSFRVEQPVDRQGRAYWLTPLLILENGKGRLGLWESDELSILDWPSFTPSDHHPYSAGSGALLLPGLDSHSARIAMLHWDDGTAYYHSVAQGRGNRVFLSWNLAKLRNSPVQSVLLAWHQSGKTLELAGITEDGALHWSRLTGTVSELDNHMDMAEMATSTAAPDEGYLATAIVRPGLIAAVTRSGVNWLRGGQRFLQVTQTLRTEAPVVAAFASLPTNELLLICDDGMLERLPVPNV